METVSEPKAVKKPPDNDLGACVQASYRGHSRASLLTGQTVHLQAFTGEPSSSFAMPVFFIVVNIAKRNQIILSIRALFPVVLHMVQFKHFSRIVGRTH
jgi:hypothetical protein